MKLARRLFLALAAALIVSLGILSPVAANAAAPVSEAAASVRILPAVDPDNYLLDPDQTWDNGYIDGILSDSDYRTTSRWFTSSNGFESLYDGFVGSQILQQADRLLIAGNVMNIGNLFMGATIELTSFASSVDFVNGMGSTIDGIVKALLQAVFGTNGTAASVLIGTIVILGVVLIIARGMRRGMMVVVRQLLALVLTMGITLGIVSQALTGTAGSGDGYQPVAGTPGWAVKTAVEGVGWLTAAPAKAFTDTLTNATTSGIEGDGPLSCNRTVQGMNSQADLYIWQKADTAGGNNPAKVAANTALDAMWNKTGMYTWGKVQFGYDNKYADKVFCRGLDMRSNHSPSAAAASLWEGARLWFNDGNYDMAAYVGLERSIKQYADRRSAYLPDDNDNRMASLVAWAACKYKGYGTYTRAATGSEIQGVLWEWEPGWVGFQGGHETSSDHRGWKMGDGGASAQQDCGEWWISTTYAPASDADLTDEQAKHAGKQDVPAIFHIKGKSGWLDDRSRNAQDMTGVRDYLGALTGVDTGAGSGAMSYSIGSFFLMLAFLFIDLITIGAKFGLVFFILALYGVLIGAMWSPSQMKDRLGKTFSKLLGLAVFTSLTAVIVAFLTMFTQSINALANDLLGRGSVGSQLFTGFAPIIALVMVHFLFTKVFKLPSPVSLRGASAWGKSGLSGAMGAAAVGGVAGAAGGSLMNRLSSLGKGEARGLASAGLNKLTGGRLGSALTDRRNSSMLGSLAQSVGKKTTKGGNAAPEANKDPKAADAQDATKSKGREARREEKAAFKSDLKEARAEHIAETGKAAPGDYVGAAKVAAAQAMGAAGRGASKVARGIGHRAADAGRTIKGKALDTSFAKELRSQAKQRRDAAQQHGLAAQDRRAKRTGIAGLAEGTAGIVSATAAAAGSAAATAQRVKLGAAAQAGSTVAGLAGSTARTVGAAADAVRHAKGGADALLRHAPESSAPRAVPTDLTAATLRPEGAPVDASGAQAPVPAGASMSTTSAAVPADLLDDAVLPDANLAQAAVAVDDLPDLPDARPSILWSDDEIAAAPEAFAALQASELAGDEVAPSIAAPLSAEVSADLATEGIAAPATAAPVVPEAVAAVQIDAAPEAVLTDAPAAVETTVTANTDALAGTPAVPAVAAPALPTPDIVAAPAVAAPAVQPIINPTITPVTPGTTHIEQELVANPVPTGAPVTGAAAPAAAPVVAPVTPAAAAVTLPPVVGAPKVTEAVAAPDTVQRVQTRVDVAVPNPVLEQPRTAAPTVAAPAAPVAGATAATPAPVTASAKAASIPAPAAPAQVTIPAPAPAPAPASVLGAATISPAAIPQQAATATPIIVPAPAPIRPATSVRGTEKAVAEITEAAQERGERTKKTFGEKLATVVSKPAAVAQKARFQVEDATQAVIGSNKAIQMATQAKVAIQQTREKGAEILANDAVQDILGATKTAGHVAAVTGRGAGAALKSVALRGRNNRALVEQLRERKGLTEAITAASGTAGANDSVDGGAPQMSGTQGEETE